MNFKRLVGDKKHHYIRLGSGSVLHHLAFGKPNEVAGTELAVMRDERSFKHIHAVGAGMGVGFVNHTGRVFDDADLHASLWVGDEILAIKGFTERFVESGFPRFGVNVYGDKGQVHCLILAWLVKDLVQ